MKEDELNGPLYVRDDIKGVKPKEREKHLRKFRFAIKETETVKGKERSTGTLSVLVIFQNLGRRYSCYCLRKVDVNLQKGRPGRLDRICIRGHTVPGMAAEELTECRGH